MFAVKICGMRSPCDVLTCALAGADAVGFIFARGPAQLDLRAAVEAAKIAPAWVTRVGVFADQSWEFVRAAVERCELDMLQFCGSETAAFRGSFDLPTIAVLGVSKQAADVMPDPEFLREARARAVLIDSRDGHRLGGTGLAVQPEFARALVAAAPLPCILAGGLQPDSVARAIGSIGPVAVDVRTGVERDGRKDPLLVRAFVHAARSAMAAEA